MRILLDESLPKDLAPLVVVLFVRRTRVPAIERLIPELLILLNHLPLRVLRKVGI